MPSRSILDRLEAGEVLILDGGTGSELQKRGVEVTKGSTVEHRSEEGGEPAIDSHHGVWSATANLDAPEVVRQVHVDYLRAGAEVIISNNFYTSRPMFELIGEAERWEAYARRAVELARQARDETNPEAYVAGGFAPPHLGNLPETFREVSRLLAESGVDFLLPEYMGGETVWEDPIADCVTAVDVCADTGLPVFLGICNLRDEGTMFHGGSIRDLVTGLRGHPVAGIFLMCSYPTAISACLPDLRGVYDGPIGAYGHLGYDENPNFGASPDEPYFIIDTLEYTPARYAEFGRAWRDAGAQIIGGCCATGPEHIAALPAALAG